MVDAKAFVEDLKEHVASRLASLDLLKDEEPGHPDQSVLLERAHLRDGVGSNPFPGRRFDLLKRSDISVDTDKHVVTLTGTMTTAAGRRKASSIALRTEAWIAW